MSADITVDRPHLRINYRRGDYHKRMVCPNALSVREDVVRDALLDTLRERLMSPEGILHARKLVAEKLSELSRVATAALRGREERLARTEARIKGLVAFIVDGDRSTCVVEALRDLEARLTADATRGARRCGRSSTTGRSASCRSPTASTSRGPSSSRSCYSNPQKTKRRPSFRESRRAPAIGCGGRMLGPLHGSQWVRELVSSARSVLETRLVRLP